MEKTKDLNPFTALEITMIDTSLKLRKRISVIYYMYLIALLIVLSLLAYFPYHNMVPETARFTVSTIVQSEAVIVGIVVSLSLLAIQLASSWYSSRVLEVIKNAPYIWIFLIIYILSIIYGIWVLTLIESNYSKIMIEYSIIVSFCVSILAFFSLIPYIFKILDLLNPIFLIDKLIRDINAENIISIERPSKNKDHIRGIVDIIIGSHSRHDEEVVYYALNALNKKIETILNINFLCIEQQEIFIESIFNNIFLLGRLLIIEKSNYTSLEAIEVLGTIGRIAAEKRFEIIASKVAISLGELGVLSIQTELVLTTSKIIDVIRDIGEKTIEQRLATAASQAENSLECIGLAAVVEGSEKEIIKIIKYLETITLKADSTQGDMISLVIISIRNIALECAKNGLRRATLHAVLSLEKLIEDLPGKNLSGRLHDAMISMEELGVVAANFKLEDSTIVAIRAFESLARMSDEYDLEISAIIRCLEELRYVSKNKGADKPVEEIDAILKKLGYQQSQLKATFS